MDLLKKQLVSLTMELDDKSKICSGMKRRIEEELGNASAIDVKVPMQYEHVLRQEAAEHQQRLSTLLEDIRKTNAERDELREACKSFKDAVLREEENIRQMKIKASEQLAVSLEGQNKAFRAGSGERMQKHLARRAAEVRESTRQDMAPLFQKVQLDYEKELSDLELRAQEEERKLRTTFQRNLQEVVEAEEARVRESCKGQSKHRSETASRQAEDLSYEHRQRMSGLVEELEGQLRKDTARVHKRVEAERAARAEELVKYQDSSNAAVAQHHRTHNEAMKKMRLEHELKIKQLEDGYLAERARLEERVRSRDVGAVSGEGAETAAGSPLRARKGSSPAGSPNKHAPKSKASASASASLAEYEDNLAAERDARIQAEIRAMHTETVRLEREWRAAHEHDRRVLVQTKEVEEANTAAHVRELNAKITELVVEREEMATDVTALKREVGELSRDVTDLREEADVLESSVAKHATRIREKQSLTSYRLNDEEANAARQVKEMRRKLESVEQRRAVKVREEEAALDEIQRAHDVELEMLEKGVKSSVQIKDREIEILQEEAAAEAHKLESLQEILKRYNQSTPASAGVAGLGLGVGSSGGSGGGVNAGRSVASAASSRRTGGTTATKSKTPAPWNHNTSVVAPPEPPVAPLTASGNYGGVRTSSSRNAPRAGVARGSTTRPKSSSSGGQRTAGTATAQLTGSRSNLAGSARDAPVDEGVNDTDTLATTVCESNVSALSHGSSRHRQGGNGALYGDDGDDDSEDIVALVNGMY